MERRNFIKKAGAASVGLSLFPTFIKASALGRDGHVAPSDRISMILVGCGSQGGYDLSSFLQSDEMQVVALCDIDENQLVRVKGSVDKRYGNSDCRVYTDYREILEK